jgi:hypothetical protein
VVLTRCGTLRVQNPAFSKAGDVKPPVTPRLKVEEQKSIPFSSVSQAKQETDSQQQLGKQQNISDQEDYENKLRRYEQKFAREIQVEYPLSYATKKALERYQQYLELKDEDIKRIEESVISQQPQTIQQPKTIKARDSTRQPKTTKTKDATRCKILLKNLQHRLEVARSQGDENLIRQLETEQAYLQLNDE